VILKAGERLIELLGSDEEMLVGAVEGLSVADTGRVMEYWKMAVDGGGTEAEAGENWRRRYLYASHTLGGMLKLDGYFDGEQADLILTALGAATPPPGPDEHRTPSQRRADALSDLCLSFLDRGEAPGVEKPHVVVLTDLSALSGQGGGLHETASGAVLPPEMLRRIACDAGISRVVFGPDSEPVDIGRESRVVPTGMRRAVIARDRHCTYPGCDRPHRWCDIHHLWHWADGGPTAVSNLQLLCRYHHTVTHRPTYRHPPAPP
jgi:hypothetical protein